MAGRAKSTGKASTNGRKPPGEPIELGPADWLLCNHFRVLCRGYATWADVARVIGISENLMSAYARGRRAPENGRLDAMLAALGKTRDDLFAAISGGSGTG